MGFSLEEESDSVINITDQFLRLASALRLEINQACKKPKGEMFIIFRD